jgi:tetratricopeptide (TPR) repeat protein
VEAAVETHGSHEVDAVASLATARQAFWQQDLDGAIKAYRAAIAADPENPDAYGELGNIYLGQGERDAASQAYLEAGLRLIEQGRPERAVRLLRVISGLDRDRARTLAQALYEARPNGVVPR